MEMTESASGNALLLATVSAVGLHVEVQVKDGSLYSGIFHTASVDEGYGIVLKKAMMIEKGSWYSDLEVGALVDTLVVLSNDLVQVIVKDFLFPMEGDICCSVGDRLPEGIDAIDSSGTDSSSGIFGGNKENKSSNFSEDADIHDHAMKLLNSLDNNQNVLGGIDSDVSREEVEVQSHSPVVSNPEGEVGEIDAHAQENSISNVENNSSTSTVACEDHHSSSCFVCPKQAMPIKESLNFLAFKQSVSGEKRCSSPVCLLTRTEGCKSTSDISTEARSSNGQISNISTSSSSLSSDSNSICSNLSTSPNFPASEGNPFFNTFTKEFRLNPEAKLFFPSCLNARPASTVIPNIVNTSYVSSIPPVMPVVAAQSSFENSSLPSCTPLPAKFVQYSPLAAGQTGINAQYPRHISGQVITRHQPARFYGQYHPAVQIGTTYMHQHSQPVMVGRAGQLVYVHPISQDPMQGTTVLSQGYPVSNIPKFEGPPAQSMQFCMSQQPLVTATPVQPFAMPSPAQFSHIPAIRPITVPGGTGFFGSKYQ